MRLEEGVPVLGSFKKVWEFFEEKAKQLKETGAPIELWGPHHREQGFYCYLVPSGASDSLQGGRILATKRADKSVRVVFYLEEFPDDRLFWELADSLIAEIRQQFQTASNAQSKLQEDSDSTQVVVTDPLVFTGTVERLEELLGSYHRSKHRSPESVWHHVGESGDLCIRYHSGEGRLITFEAIEPETGKLTIVRRTYPRRWKDYFEELIEAIFRRWLSTQYYTCFMSYSSRDQEFAEQLHNDLQSKGVRCWFAPEDMKIGDRIRPSIDVAIQSYDKLLLVLSEHSIDSDWVEKEVETAFEEERKRKTTILFPIRLDSAVMETDQAWAADIRRIRYIGDFTRWKDYDAYQQAFERLLRDLKAGEVVEADT